MRSTNPTICKTMLVLDETLVGLYIVMLEVVKQLGFPEDPFRVDEVVEGTADLLNGYLYTRDNHNQLCGGKKRQKKTLHCTLCPVVLSIAELHSKAQQETRVRAQL